MNIYSIGHTASFKIGVSKVQDFGNFELSLLFCTIICVFECFDSLRPINNLSVKQGWIFLG